MWLCGVLRIYIWMRRGDVVGVHGGGSWVVLVLGGVGARWDLVEYRMIGERENGICGWFGICDWGDCGGVDGVIGLSSVLAAFPWVWGDMRYGFAVVVGLSPEVITVV